MLTGIHGKIGSGKDILAMYIKKEVDSRNHVQGGPGTVRIKKFADKLKDIMCMLTGCSRNQLEDREFKESNLPPEWDRFVVRRIDSSFNGIKASELCATWNEAEACKMNLTRLNHGEDVYKVCQEPITYRIALQEIGSDLFRDKLHPNTWVNALFADWKQQIRERHWLGNAISMSEELSDQWPKWIISDVRFPNEVGRIRKYGGIVIRIERSLDLRDPEGLAAAILGTGNKEFGISPVPLGSKMYDAAKRVVHEHVSEKALDNYDGFDAVVDNNGTLEELQEKARDIVNKFNLK